MSNNLYDAWKTGLMQAGANVSLVVDTPTDGPFCSLVDKGVKDFTGSDQFYSDMVAATVGTTQRITAPTVVTAVFDGNNVTFPLVSGATCEALLIYRNNAGGPTAARLVAFIDGAAGLPVTPNGGDIQVTWHTSGIFKL